MSESISTPKFGNAYYHITTKALGLIIVLFLLIGIEFTVADTKFINFEKSGHKLFLLFLEGCHVDTIYENHFPSITMELLQLTDARKLKLH